MTKYVALTALLIAMTAHAQVLVRDPELANPWGASDTETDSVPNVAADRNGNLIMVWATNRDIAGDVGDDLDIAFIRSRDFGLTWSNPNLLNDHATTDTTGNLGEADFNPDIETNGRGLWIAVWSYGFEDPNGSLPESGADYDIYVAESTNHGFTWTNARPLGAKGLSDGSLPGQRDEDSFARIATNGQGTWLTTWVEDLSTVYVARATEPFVNWDAGTIVSTVGGTLKLDPVVASDGKKTWIIAWNQTLATTGEILFVISTDDGMTWSSVAELGFQGIPDLGQHPDIAYNADAGRWFAAFASPVAVGNSGADVDILFTSSANGFSWTGPTPLYTAATLDASTETQPYFANDGNENWAVGMIRTSDTKGANTLGHDVVVAISTDNGSTFGGPFSIGDLVDGETGTDEVPVITGTGSENWSAIWQVSGGGFGVDQDVLRSDFGFTGSLVGRVETVGGLPLSCATIVANREGSDFRRAATNNANGFFRLEGLPAGDYSVAVVTDATVIDIQNVTIETSKRSIAKFVIDTRGFPGAIFGRVRQRNTNTFLVDARVEVVQNDIVIATTRTCATGQYAFFDLFGKLKGSENVDINFMQEGFDDETMNVNVDPEAGTEVDQEMDLKGVPVLGSLTGVITDAESMEGIQGATVTLQGGIFVSALADNDGIFVFPNLLASNYSAEASAENFDSITVGANIKSTPDVTILNFELTPGSDSPAGPQDINGDTQINAIDIQLIINAVLGIPIAPFVGDVDGDGITNSIDIQLVINSVLGL